MPALDVGNSDNHDSFSELEEFHYRVSWRSRSASPGHHRSTQSGGGFDFHGHAPLISHPVPRNLDVRASLLDPFGQHVVRTFRQRSAIPVFVIADLSASMAFVGNRSKQQTLAWFSACTAYSAFRSGDPFGFVGCGEKIDEQLCWPLRWYKGIAEELFMRLNTHTFRDRSADGLFDSIDRVGRCRSLIFLVSDFHFPLNTINRLIQLLDKHDVIPVVLWDRKEWEYPKWGIKRMTDSENGKYRYLVLRPALQRRIYETFEQRRRAIQKFCTVLEREPFFVMDSFRPSDLTRYFYH